MDTTQPTPIADICHPLYQSNYEDWCKWRLCFKGGTEFINAYLKRYSKSEDTDDFRTRTEITYNPGFARSAILEVRNSIYQRLSDISRIGGSESYKEAVKGESSGVDKLGSSMNTFMGMEVTEELLVMGRVGVYVDMPVKTGNTLADTRNLRPYLYVYKIEDIRSWRDDESSDSNQFIALLLRDTDYIYDQLTGLPLGVNFRYRYYFKNANGEVWVRFFDHESNPIDIEYLSIDNYINYGTLIQGNTNFHEDIILDYNPQEKSYKLAIDRIPFVSFETNSPLMADIADYQIGLLNLASADMNYAFCANFPFYTEQFDPRWENPHIKTPATVTEETGGVTTPTAPSQTIGVGPTSGRRYSRGLDRPDFIHPSPEPMKVSMEKQDQMKLEIRLLINLSISNIQAKMASADSKGMDERTLESGLSYIGLVLEDGERQIAEIWHLYENKFDVLPTINYPKKYSLQNDKDIRDEVDWLKKNMSSTSSITYKKECAKRIAELVIGVRVSNEVLDKIKNEIDKSPVPDVIIAEIKNAVDGGYLDSNLAATLLGYPEGTAKKAQEEKVERLKQIQAAQAPKIVDTPINNPVDNPAARGIPDLSVDPKGQTKIEKAVAGNPVRGKGK